LLSVVLSFSGLNFMKLIIIFFLMIFLNTSFAEDYSAGFLSGLPSFINAKVLNIVDGDTILIKLSNSFSNSLRLLYIDSIETCENDRLVRQMFKLRKMGKFVRKKKIIQLGIMAKNKASEMLKEGSLIQVEMPEGQKMDIYNRLLGVVFINGTNFNYYMVRNGYALTYFFNPEKTERAKFYRTEFRKAEREAKEEGIGIWQE